MGNKLNQEVEKALKVLIKGGTILYPTDTIWGIGCDATNAKAVEKVYHIKQRPDSKSLIILVSDTEQLQEYVQNIPPIIFDLIKQSEKPITIIYPKGKGLASNVIAEDGSVGIRIVNHPFCQKLIRILGKPIVSTSANISGTPSPICFRAISQEICNSVDYVVEIDQELIEEIKPSRIIKLEENGLFTVIRE
jgi:L-threonylcarbamoyladenylate synthase